MDNIPVLAAMSKGYLSAGSAIMIRDQNGRQQPFINPEQAWQLGNIRGDYPSVRVSFIIPPLADWAKEMLVSK